MPNPSTNHLKLHIEDSKDGQASLIDLPRWSALQQSIERLTQHKLDIVSDSELPKRSQPIVELPAMFGDESGFLVDHKEATGKTKAQTSDTQPLVDSLASLLRELQLTRQQLRYRETELATAIPMIGRLDDVADFNHRLEAILRGTVEGLNGAAAAVYLLDEDTTHLKLRVQSGLPSSSLLEPERSLRGSVADLEALTGHAVVLEDTQLFAHWNVPESFESAVCIPISSPDTLLGTLWFFGAEPRDYTDQETQLLEIIAGRMASELERRVLIRDAVAAKASRNQGDALVTWHEERTRQAPPVLDDWQVSGTVVNCEKPRGDFHTWRLGDTNQLTLTTAAVAGPVDRAMLTSSLLHGAIRMSMLQAESADKSLARVNDVMWSSAPDSEGVSVFFGHLDLDTGQLSYATAGATDAYILRPYGWEPIAEDSPPLGVDEQRAPGVDVQQIQPGDVLLVISDRDLASGEHPPKFCTTSLAEELLRNIHLSADELTELGMKVIRERCESPNARSLMVVKRAEAEPVA